MIENIIKTEQGFKATIDEVDMFIPFAEGNRHYQMIQEAIADGAEVIIEQPPTPPIPNLSFAQLLIGLVSEGWITTDEGRAWRDRISLPPAIITLIAQLPFEQQFAAETRALTATEIVRLDPLVISLGLAQDKTPEQLDQFFLKYREV